MINFKLFATELSRLCQNARQRLFSDIQHGICVSGLNILCWVASGGYVISDVRCM